MKYTLVMRGHPRYPERGKKAYACAQYEKTLSIDELLDYITLHGSAFRKGDYKAVISTIAEAMAEKMAEGYKIDLAEMGSNVRELKPWTISIPTSTSRPFM